MAVNTGYYPAPGQQNPTKYPFVRDNYRKYGEQPGYIYDPYTDEYYIDPKAYENYYREQGLIEDPPKPPGLADTLLPIAGVLGTGYAAQELGAGIGKKIPGLIGLGESTTPVTTVPTATTTTPAAAGGVTGQLPSTLGASAQAANIGPVADGAQYATSIGAEAPGMFGLEGIGSAGNAILPIAGTIGAYDLLANQRKGGRGVLQGAASGAAIGSYFGPTGAIVGGSLGGLIGLGQTLFGDKDEWKREKNKLEDLRERGVYVPDEIFAGMPTQGRSKEELVAIENEKLKQGLYGNPTFAQSRDEKDLKPEDIVGYSAFAEKDPEWFKKPLQERLNVAQELLAAKAVDEHHGTISIDWNKLNQPSGPAPTEAKKPVREGQSTEITPAPQFKKPEGENKMIPRFGGQPMIPESGLKPQQLQQFGQRVDLAPGLFGLGGQSPQPMPKPVPGAMSAADIARLKNKQGFSPVSYPLPRGGQQQQLQPALERFARSVRR